MRRCWSCVFETPSLITSLDMLTACICSSSPDEVFTFPIESAGLSLDSMRPSPVSPVSCNTNPDYASLITLTTPPLNRQLSQNHASKHEAKLWSVSLHTPPANPYLVGVRTKNRNTTTTKIENRTKKRNMAYIPVSMVSLPIYFLTPKSHQLVFIYQAVWIK